MVERDKVKGYVNIQAGAKIASYPQILASTQEDYFYQVKRELKASH